MRRVLGEYAAVYRDVGTLSEIQCPAFARQVIAAIGRVVGENHVVSRKCGERTGGLVVEDNSPAHMSVLDESVGQSHVVQRQVCPDSGRYESIRRAVVHATDR